MNLLLELISVMAILLSLQYNSALAMKGAITETSKEKIITS